MKPGYITVTRRQSNNKWSGGIAAHPFPTKKIRVAKIRWKISRLEFFISRCHPPPHWLSYKGPNYQRGVLLISAGAIEGHFEGKSRSNFTKAHQALATQKNLAYLVFQCLDYPPYSPNLTPSVYHLFPGL